MRNTLAVVLVGLSAPAAATERPALFLTASVSAGTLRTGTSSSPYCYYGCREHPDGVLGLNLELGARRSHVALSVRTSVFYYAADENSYVMNLDVPMLLAIRILPWSGDVEPYVAVAGGVGVRHSWNQYDDVGIEELVETTGESTTTVRSAFSIAFGVNVPIGDRSTLDLGGEVLCMNARVPAHNLAFLGHVGFSFGL